MPPRCYAGPPWPMTTVLRFEPNRLLRFEPKALGVEESCFAIRTQRYDFEAVEGYAQETIRVRSIAAPHPGNGTGNWLAWR